ncbi:hypothetical protein NQ317_010488 [Molorchus minor]|uniref:Ubiquinone biosynthesis O-methyltransferase, mitochondrial n=1 Tax=Molorchus minor TaxID=1323400 RepID=A0ABQ9JYF8_9CUCU|nr:hypothetical protein NQ317_010488 [Molorchus minor]
MLIRAIGSRWQNFRKVATASSVDNEEIQHFEKFICEWWNEFGPMKPLHSMNKLRIPFIRDGLINAGALNHDDINNPKILKNVSILDVGCGGGILSEPLARLGSNVTGIDASTNLVHLAQVHAKRNSLEINYLATSIEEHSSKNVEKYDAVVASEVLEHVVEKEKFLEACAKCLKPMGSIFITSISKTLLANFAVIFLAENTFQQLPKGTHQFEKFIEPSELQKMLEDQNCRTKLVHGIVYNVFTNNWHWCRDTSVNFAIQAVKLKSK